MIGPSYQCLESRSDKNVRKHRHPRKRALLTEIPQSEIMALIGISMKANQFRPITEFNNCGEDLVASISYQPQISSHNALLQGPSKACRYNYLQGPNKEPVVSYLFCRVLSKRAFRNDYWREVVRRMGQALVKARWKVAFMKPLPFPIFLTFWPVSLCIPSRTLYRSSIVGFHCLT